MTGRLSPAPAFVLYLLRMHGPRTVKWLIECSGMYKNTVNRAIYELIQKGLITREWDKTSIRRYLYSVREGA